MSHAVSGRRSFQRRTRYLVQTSRTHLRCPSGSPWWQLLTAASGCPRTTGKVLGVNLNRSELMPSLTPLPPTGNEEDAHPIAVRPTAKPPADAHCASATTLRSILGGRGAWLTI